MRVGELSSFYHESGRGETRTVGGWRVGKILATPTRGAKKDWVQLELRAERWGFDLALRRWFRKPNTRVWVPRSCVNRLGDVRYHGLSEVEVVRERKAKKTADQAAADKKLRKVGRR
jgi:hypothetical protein